MDDQGEDSISNLPLWRDPDGKAVRDNAVQQSIDGSLSIRNDKWKLAMCPGSGGWSDPKPGEEKISSPRSQLFDLSADTAEKTNLVEKYTHVVKELKEKLRQQVIHGRSTVGAPLANEGVPVWSTVLWMEES